MKFIIALLFSLIIFTACTTDTKTTDDQVTESNSIELTLEELATFNGKDGQQAYIAVDGIIYDVTESNFWKNGKHNGYEAGIDLTEAIKNQSPHGISKLENVTEIGILVAE